MALEEIERIAEEEATLGWEARRLTRARQRIGDGVASWFSGIHERRSSYTCDVDKQLSLKVKMRSLMHFARCFQDLTTTFADHSSISGGLEASNGCFSYCRTNELFDIIVDYPDSMAALEDLKVRTLGARSLTEQECLFKVDQRSILVDKLKAA